VPCILQGIYYIRLPINHDCTKVSHVITHPLGELGVGILYFALVSSLWWLALCLSVFDVRRNPSTHLRVGVH
jgi:hypothetical protein